MPTDTAVPPRPAPRPSAHQGSSRAGVPWRQLLTFGAVGAGSTLAYALLYLALHPLAGAFAANALALLLTAVANTAVNRRLTFGVRGTAGVLGDHAVGMLAFGAGLALTTGALAALHAVSDPGRIAELVVLTVANAVATLVRFVVLRLAFDRSRG